MIVSRSVSQSFLIEKLERLTIPLVLGPMDKHFEDKVSAVLLDPICRALKDVSHIYVNSLEKEGASNLSRSFVDAYLLYYLPINAAKIFHLLNIATPFLPQARHLNVLDFGSGPGTASLTLALVTEQDLTVTAVETNPFMRDAFLNLSTVLSSDETIQRQNRKLLFQSKSDLYDIKENFDIIFASNVLNELPENERDKTVSRLLALLSEHGVLIILEPGSFQETRGLMQLRKDISGALKNDSKAVLYPCTHSGPCPLLPFSDQWCHRDILFARSALIRQIDELTNFNKHRVKLSSLIIGPEEFQPRNTYRIIASPAKSKAGVQSFVCGSSYSGLVTLQKRDRTEQNRLFEKVEIHDEVLIKGPFEKGYLSKESVVLALDSTPQPKTP